MCTDKRSLNQAAMTAYRNWAMAEGVSKRCGFIQVVGLLVSLKAILKEEILRRQLYPP